MLQRFQLISRFLIIGLLILSAAACKEPDLIQPWPFNNKYDTLSTYYVPRGVSGFKAEILSETAVYLSWTDISIAEKGFLLRRRIPPSSILDTLTVLAPNTISYIDSVVLHTGKTHDYSIVAIGNYLPWTSNSANASATLSMPPPVLTFVETPSLDQVTLQWLHETNLAAMYVIEAKSSAEGDTVINVHPLVYIEVPANQYVSPADTNNSYWFRVRSLTSTLSNEVHLQFLTNKWTLVP